MSKAILIMDMPESCKECDSCIIGSVVFCGINGEKIKQKTMNENKKLEKCPLQDLPERKKENKYHNSTEKGYVSGWNACIDVLEVNEEE